MPAEVYKTGPGTLVVGEVGSEVDFSAQVLSAVVSWSKEKADDRKVLSGETVAGATTYTASLSVTILQDLALAAGIVAFSWANKGEEHPFTFVPNTVADKEVTGTVVIDPVDIGGEVDTDAESEFEWSIVGDPALADITP